MLPKEQIDKQISELTDFRGEMYSTLRNLVNSVNPNLKEEFKWGTAVWTLNGMVCAVSTFKDKVKINFFKGALINDTKGLFNSGLDSKNHRSIDYYEGDNIDANSIKELILQAIKLNEK